MALSRRRRGAALAIGAMVALGTSACLQDPDAGGSGAGGGDVTAEGGSTDGDGVVTILGAFGGDEQALFEDSLAEFEEQSGIDVQYTSDSNFTVTVQQRASSGNSADISIFPQPGGLLQLAASGDIQPIDTYLDYDALDSTLIGNFLPASRLNGRVYAAPMRMAVKSLVWYDKANYAAANGDTEPASYEELEQNLTQNMEDGGTSPWCMGWGSDAATGWVGTDWIEDYVLRMYGPDVYDQWVSHDIPFNDERIVAAFDKYAEIAREPQAVLGGARGIVATPFGEAMTPAFEDDPTCYVMKQGNFISGFFPEEVQDNLDDEVGVFSFPGFTDAEDPTVAAGADDATAPVLIGGDLAALMNGDDEDAIEVMRFLTSPEFGGPWAQGGGWISPHRTFDSSLYANDTTRDMAQIAIDAPVARYDASDSMPSAVGSGSWWTGMVDWVQGASSQDVTDEIEASWPEDGEGS